MPSKVLILLLLVTGVSFGQSTDFSTGPQYLVTTSSPLFLRPISTPSLSLGEVQSAGASFGATEAAVAEEAPSPSEITHKTFYSDVYWGEHSLAEIEARRLVTPSLSLSETTLGPETPSAGSGFLPGLPPQFPPQTSQVIEISSAALPANLPPSIFDPGVTAVADAQTLRERGYGVPLGDVASFWKTHKRGAGRVFTNRDVQQLRNH